MSKVKKSETTSATQPTAARKSSTGNAEIQAKVDKENAQGFRGIETDSTPNANYTVSGVVSGAPTPETDVESAKKVRDESGLGMSALESAAREKDAAASNAANSRKIKRGK